MIREEISKNRGKQFDPEITDVFLKLLDEKRVVLHNIRTQEITAPPEADHTINKFISEVVSTIKNQEDSKNYDFLTGLPMRSLGERLIAEFMQEHNGCLIFLDMDNLKKIKNSPDARFCGRGFGNLVRVHIARARGVIRLLSENL